jgi:hypothetical protein
MATLARLPLLLPGRGPGRRRSVMLAKIAERENARYRMVINQRPLRGRRRVTDNFNSLKMTITVFNPH